MLAEAIDIIRQLWRGETVSYDGSYYEVDEARLFTLPENPIEIMVAASGGQSAELAAEIGDGLIGVAPDESLLATFDETASRPMPKYGQVTLAWGQSEADARQTLTELWPQSGLGGNLKWETKTWQLFEDGVKPLTEEQIVGKTPCGPDPEAHLEAIRAFEQAGYTHISLHQIGRDHRGFFRFFEEELKPRL